MSESCRFEPEVIRAAEEDRWTDALREHVTECDDCVAAMTVAPWLDRFARISDREHMLPDPSVVWLKARLLQGAAEAARASRPLDLVQIFAYVIVAGGWAALLGSRWSAIESWMRSFTPVSLMATASRADSLPASFVAMLLVLGAMTVTLGLHTILAEE